MSNKYKYGDRVPSQVLCNRLDELADAVTKGGDSVRRTFTMRVPAELDYDADLVLSQSSRRIVELEKALKISTNELQDWALKGGGKNSFNIISSNFELLKGK